MEGASVVAADGSGPGFRAATGWGGHLRATLSLGAPLVGAQLAQMAINVTDTVVVGRLGPAELAAAVLATQGFFFVWIFGAGFAQGAMPIAASAEGRGDRTAVRRSVRMSFWVVGLCGAAAMVPLWHFEAILVALGQKPEIAALAGSFMRILEWGMVPALFVAAGRTALSVVARANVVLLLTLGGAVVNGLLDWLLVFGGFGIAPLGLNGAAIASVTANFAMAAAMFAYCGGAAAVRPYRFLQRIWRPDWPAFSEILKLGWPISTTIIAEVSLFTASSIMMGWLGTVELAAHGIALQLASIAFMVPLGLSQAASVRVGVAFGARDWLGLGRAGWSAVALALGFGFAGASLFWWMPETLVGLYLDAREPGGAAVLAVGARFVLVAAAFQMIDCLQVVASSLLRGLADTRVPMLMALVSYWAVGMPVAWLLAFAAGIGGLGIWIGLATGLFAAALLMTARFAMRARLGLTPA